MVSKNAYHNVCQIQRHYLKFLNLNLLNSKTTSVHSLISYIS